MKKEPHILWISLCAIGLATLCFQLSSCGNSSDDFDEEAYMKEVEERLKKSSEQYFAKVKPFSLYKEHDFSEKGFSLILVLAGGCSGPIGGLSHSGYIVTEPKVLQQLQEDWVLEKKAGLHMCGYHSHASLFKNGERIQANAMDVGRGDGSHLIVDGVGYLFPPEKLKVVTDAGKPINEMRDRFSSVKEGREFLISKRIESTFIFDLPPSWETIDGHVHVERQYDCSRLVGDDVFKMEETRIALQRVLRRKDVVVVSKGGTLSRNDGTTDPCEIKYEVQLNRDEVKKLKGWKIVQPWKELEYIDWTYYEYANRDDIPPSKFSMSADSDS